MDTTKPNIYLLDYLNLIYLNAGYFTSEADAMEWVRLNDPDQAPFYKVVPILAADYNGTNTVKYTRYACQR